MAGIRCVCNLTKWDYRFENIDNRIRCHRKQQDISFWKFGKSKTPLERANNDLESTFSECGNQLRTFRPKSKLKVRKNAFEYFLFV